MQVSVENVGKLERKLVVRLPADAYESTVRSRIAEAGRLLGVTVHDHVIIGRDGHVSLRAKGLV